MLAVIVAFTLGTSIRAQCLATENCHSCVSTEVPIDLESGYKVVDTAFGHLTTGIDFGVNLAKGITQHVPFVGKWTEKLAEFTGNPKCVFADASINGLSGSVCTSPIAHDFKYYKDTISWSIDEDDCDELPVFTRNIALLREEKWSLFNKFVLHYWGAEMVMAALAALETDAIVILGDPIQDLSSFPRDSAQSCQVCASKKAGSPELMGKAFSDNLDAYRNRLDAMTPTEVAELSPKPFVEYVQDFNDGAVKRDRASTLRRQTRQLAPQSGGAPAQLSCGQCRWIRSRNNRMVDAAQFAVSFLESNPDFGTSTVALVAVVGRYHLSSFDPNSIPSVLRARGDYRMIESAEWKGRFPALVDISAVETVAATHLATGKLVIFLGTIHASTEMPLEARAIVMEMKPTFVEVELDKKRYESMAFPMVEAHLKVLTRGREILNTQRALDWGACSADRAACQTCIVPIHEKNIEAAHLFEWEDLSTSAPLPAYCQEISASTTLK